MSDLISKEKAIRLIDEIIHNSREEFFDSEWARGEVNGLGVAKDIILSGQCDPDPVPTIKPGDKHRCPYCNIASTQQEWDENTDKAYNGDAATIHDCKTLNLLALFVCPACGEEAELHQMEVVE